MVRCYRPKARNRNVLYERMLAATQKGELKPRFPEEGSFHLNGVPKHRIIRGES